ncbi:myb DNA-binding domain superfamily protein-related [Anaeramoeba flamelloides]|uniref:Myb DNA-binding domain superfamily protein-related n=1 Tax=Anaeramoeba flamelloides TaxID=1746091 RepID=A0AAV8A4Z4_9EUKA|nr:myb DNA-binding domain superfamily protein-related [Anaeramoeba flamelloides]
MSSSDRKKKIKQLFKKVKEAPNLATVKHIKTSIWSKKEDDILAKAVKLHKGQEWDLVAELFQNKNSSQCLHRWKKVLDPKLKKGSWSKEEDQFLKQGVKSHGQSWPQVSLFVPGRTAKQCRERWMNQLDPSIYHGPWREEEDMILIEKHRIFGNQWSKIKKFLHGRPDNVIKNRWNTTLKKRFPEEIKRNSKKVSSSKKKKSKQKKTKYSKNQKIKTSSILYTSQKKKIKLKFKTSTTFKKKTPIYKSKKNQAKKKKTNRIKDIKIEQKNLKKKKPSSFKKKYNEIEKESVQIKKKKKLNIYKKTKSFNLKKINKSKIIVNKKFKKEITEKNRKEKEIKKKPKKQEEKTNEGHNGYKNFTFKDEDNYQDEEIHSPKNLESLLVDLKNGIKIKYLDNESKENNNKKNKNCIKIETEYEEESDSESDSELECDFNFQSKSLSRFRSPTNESSESNESDESDESDESNKSNQDNESDESDIGIELDSKNISNKLNNNTNNTNNNNNNTQNKRQVNNNNSNKPFENFINQKSQDYPKMINLNMSEKSRNKTQLQFPPLFRRNSLINHYKIYTNNNYNYNEKKDFFKSLTPNPKSKNILGDYNSNTKHHFNNKWGALYSPQNSRKRQFNNENNINNQDSNVNLAHSHNNNLNLNLTHNHNNNLDTNNNHNHNHSVRQKLSFSPQTAFGKQTHSKVSRKLANSQYLEICKDDLFSNCRSPSQQNSKESINL